MNEMAKRRIKLTESGLRRLIRNVIAETYDYNNEYDDGNVLMYDGIVSPYDAEEIANEDGYDEEWLGAARWFDEVYYEGNWTREPMPSNASLKGRSRDGLEIYYDYGADYYFAVADDILAQKLSLT